jgi:hypothetical protein
MDLPLLARRLLETSSTGLGKPSSGFSPEAQACHGRLSLARQCP